MSAASKLYIGITISKVQVSAAVEVADRAIAQAVVALMVVEVEVFNMAVKLK